MYIKYINKSAFLRVFLILMLIVAIMIVPNKDKEIKASSLVIVLDPGHGGTDPGAVYYYDGQQINESMLNMKITTVIKQELLKYSGITVILTRENDTYLTLEERVNFAVSRKANSIISIHNNASTATEAKGSEVMVASGNDGSAIHLVTKELGSSILYKLSESGLNKRGLVQRLTNSFTYPNGKPADYYGIVRNSIIKSTPGIIVECAFLSNESDYRNYLSKEDKILEIGQAIANGIAQYYKLTKVETEFNGLGDINNDTFITAYDGYVLSNHIKTGSKRDEAVSDVTGDGVIDVNDVLQLLKFSAGLIDQFPKGKTNAILRSDTQGIAIINTTEDDPYLNVRTGPSTSYTAIGAFYKGSRVSILDDFDKPWCYVRGICSNTGKIVEGYSSKAFLSIQNINSEQIDFDITESTESNLNLLFRPSKTVTTGCFTVRYDSEQIEFDEIITNNTYVIKDANKGELCFYLIKTEDPLPLFGIKFIIKNKGISKTDLLLNCSELTNIEGNSYMDVEIKKEVRLQPQSEFKTNNGHAYIPDVIVCSEFLSKYANIEYVLLKDKQIAPINTLIGTGMFVVINETEYEVIVSGDVNGDGSIDKSDIIIIQEHILDKELMTGCNYNAADINKDMIINALDIALIQKNIYES